MNQPHTVTFEDVQAAARRIAGKAHRTPVMTSRALDEMAGRRLFFKCENFQRVGAFKFRGACNAVMKLSDEEASRGVVTHSSGNHAQAVALAAKLRGIPAHIVMPSNAPSIKRQAVAGYGARIITCEPTSAAREATAADVAAQTGATFVHPSNAADVIAGQGTLALELLEEVPDLDAIIAPVGGGGLMSGVCVGARGVKPDIRLFGAEPLGADDAARSLAAGHIIPQTQPQTVADGLRTSLGDLTFPILRDHLERILTIEERPILDGMRLIWERMKLVIEPSAGVGVAAALDSRFQALEGMERVGVVLCGGNLDLDQLPWTSPSP